MITDLSGKVGLFFGAVSQVVIDGLAVIRQELGQFGVSPFGLVDERIGDLA
jgi:hypothetical protein